MKLSRFLLISFTLHAALFLVLPALTGNLEKEKTRVAELQLLYTREERPVPKKDRVASHPVSKYKDKQAAGRLVEAVAPSFPVESPPLSPVPFKAEAGQQGKPEVVPHPEERSLALEIASSPLTEIRNIEERESLPGPEQSRPQGPKPLVIRASEQEYEASRNEKKERGPPPALAPSSGASTPPAPGINDEAKRGAPVILGPGEPVVKVGGTSGTEKASTPPYGRPAGEPSGPGPASVSEVVARGNDSAVATREVGSERSGQAGPEKATASLFPAPDYSSWLKVIRDKIERAKVYPRMARHQGLEGKTTLRFKINSQGQVEKVEIVESSGSSLLDSAAISAVRQAAPFPYVPGWLLLPILFELNTG